MGSISALSEAVANVATAAGPRVVGVGPGWGLGSGVVVEEGRVVTNAHNVARGEVAVRFSDGHEAAASVVARDPDGDLAVLAVDTGDLGAIDWAEASPGLGTAVVALANPGGRGLRATFGLVSGTGRAFRGPRHRRITGSIEHTAPMGRGSSGGPLLDTDGRLLGINTHRLGDGFYLAQPADETLRARIDALARGEAPRQPRLGIALVPDRAAHRLRAAVGLPQREGVLVGDVDPDGPAGRSGVRRGDLLVAAGDRDLAGADDLFDVLAAHEVGTPLRLRAVRGADQLDLEVTLEGEAVA